MSAERPPPGLKTAGRKLWKQVDDGYDLRADERASLEAACRTLDELRALERELKRGPTFVAGSKGQDRPNPLYAEVRSHRLALRQLLAAVGLVDVDGSGTVSAGAARSNAGRALARQRWGTRGAA